MTNRVATEIIGLRIERSEGWLICVFEVLGRLDYRVDRFVLHGRKGRAGAAQPMNIELWIRTMDMHSNIDTLFSALERLPGVRRHIPISASKTPVRVSTAVQAPALADVAPRRAQDAPVAAMSR